MPLESGNSRSVISHNIREMRAAGHPERVAVAAALSNADRHPMEGGGALSFLPAIEAALQIARQPVRRPSQPHPRVDSHSAHSLTATKPPKIPEVKGIDFNGGLIDAPVHGRTDKIPLNVPSGSYILPADIVSALGQGNTKAGAAVIQEVANSSPYRSASGGPYGASEREMTHGRGPPGPRMGGGPPQPPPNAERLGDVAGPEPPHMAQGGATDRVPIIAAGGEYVLGPADVRYFGAGDIDRGHRNLDALVVAARKKLRDTLAKLKPPKKD